MEDTDFEICPYCGGTHFVRYGKSGESSVFSVKTAKIFITTTHTLMSVSHQPVSIWKEVISDTVNGSAIDSAPVVLEQVVELNETFVLKHYKGKELLPELNRPA